MYFNDLLEKAGIEPKDVLIMRHAPKSPRTLREALPKLAVEQPNVFNAYQQSQKEREEKMLTRAKYLASFVAPKSDKAEFVGLYAEFVGLYQVRGWRPISIEEFWSIPENSVLGKLGMRGDSYSHWRSRFLWFDLEPMKEFNNLKSKLTISWHGPKSFARWAHSSGSNFRVLKGSELIRNTVDALRTRTATAWHMSVGQPEEDEAAFPEGRELFLKHRARERNSTVIQRAKSLFVGKHGRFFCEACGFDFEKVYGQLGHGFIEAHHTIAVSTLSENSETKVSDIAMLCPNCHRMVHRRRPWLCMKDLQSILK